MGYIWALWTQEWAGFCIWDLHKKQFGLEYAYGLAESNLGIDHWVLRHVQCRVSVDVYGCMG